MPATSDLAELTERVWGSFLGRCVRRFLTMSGIDRCLMLSSQAFTALIPLLILIASLAPVGQEDVVSRTVIRRFALQGDAAGAVTQLFDIPDTTASSVGLFSALLLIASGTSFARRLQTMYRMAWGEEKSGVRSGAYAALGLLVLIAEVGVLYVARAAVRNLPASWAFTLPLSIAAGVVLWTSIPYLLLNRKVHWRRLVAGGLVASVGTAVYAVATSIYMPGLVERYTNEFGLFGITIALIGWLLATAGVLVTSAAIGAEFDAWSAPWALGLKERLGLKDPAREMPSTTDQAVGLTPDDLRLLARVLLSWLVLTASVWLATALVPGIRVTGGVVSYLLLSLAVALVNALLAVVPRALGVPVSTVVVALLAVLVNGLMLTAASVTSPRLSVDGPLAAVLGALAVAAVTTAIGATLRPIRDGSDDHHLLAVHDQAPQDQHVDPDDQQ